MELLVGAYEKISVSVNVEPWNEGRLKQLLDAMMMHSPVLSLDDCLDEIFMRGVRETERVYRKEERND